MVITNNDGIYTASYASQKTFGYSAFEAIKKMLQLMKLLAMSQGDFEIFYEQLPQRTKFLVKGGLCDWRTILPEFITL